jgi:hypothetical protein
MRLVNKIIFVNFLFVPTAVLSSDWIFLSQDDQSRVFISVDPLDKVSPREVRVQVKSVYTNQHDLMGLSYNVSKNEYLYSCESNLALEKQQFLFNDEELVWTFPKVVNPEKINIKMPDEPLKVACN